MRGLLARFFAGTGGIAAVEFAMILPVLILIYAGVVDLTRMAVESRKVENVSHTISDLVSQQPTQKQLSPATIASIFTSATAVMAPYSAAGVTMTVSAVSLQAKADGSCCNAAVLWSYSQGGPLRPCGIPLEQVPAAQSASPSTIPREIVQTTILGPYSTATIVIADVHDDYQPIFKKAAVIISGSLNRTTYVLPRGAGQLNVTQPFQPVGQQMAISCP